MESFDSRLFETPLGPPGVLGIWGSAGNYFQGSGEQAYSFEDLGSFAKSIFFKISP